MPPPLPPSVNDGRMMVGKPISAWISSASSSECAMRRARALEADLGHRHAEQLAVLGHVDRLARGADQLDAVLLQHAPRPGRARSSARSARPSSAAARRALLGDDRSTVCQLIGSM
jgi:hypothetical protein